MIALHEIPAGFWWALSIGFWVWDLCDDLWRAIERDHRRLIWRERRT